ncbi:carboxylesterase [Variovorax guangxiensis]|uniref:Carboxylesterase n=1 Tax=Variovorax guangxiensis TaxID=1775474 RepID=A0A433MQF2_9BURK|nr:dienelactone hydrolase family protein [Variovorax guangxiensis]RUR70086.1 carboxylesterase [Variovorax guangxiensis]
MSRPPIEIETAPNPTATVIVMHGLGADGNDFVPIAGELDLSAVGPVRFVFPNAPVMPVTINGGYRMPAWYDIVVPDLEAQEDEAGLRRSQATIEAVIANEKARGIAAGRIVVAGFSQGCAMALMTGLRHTERLAGVVGLSGYLPIAATTAAERHAANHETPVFLAHGRQDPVVPYAAAVRTREALSALGYAVEWHEYDMAHSVCMEEVADLNRFLLRVLG